MFLKLRALWHNSFGKKLDLDVIQNIDHKEPMAIVDEPTEDQGTIKHCPLCDGPAARRLQKRVFRKGAMPMDVHSILCQNCKLETRGFINEDAVVKLWNNRPNERKEQ